MIRLLRITLGIFLTLSFKYWLLCTKIYCLLCVLLDIGLNIKPAIVRQLLPIMIDWLLWWFNGFSDHTSVKFLIFRLKNYWIRFLTSRYCVCIGTKLSKNVNMSEVTSYYYKLNNKCPIKYITIYTTLIEENMSMSKVIRY